MLGCVQNAGTGFTPAELMIGRSLVYPIQFAQEDIDLSGTTMTAPLLQKLKSIRENNFTQVSKKISKAQKIYKKHYDKRMNATHSFQN